MTPPPLWSLLTTEGAARRGRLATAHGVVETPVFMPVGTRGTVKSLTPDDVHTSYNLWMGASLDAQGRRHIHWNRARKDDYVELLALFDTLCVPVICGGDLSNCNNLDVVPVEPESAGRWREAPFGGRIADGFAWGRGAIDNKAGVVGMLEAVELLLAEGFKPARTIG